jgi:hypothetical protein
MPTLTVPEIGPLMPALVAPAEAVAALAPDLAPARLALATACIERAAAARTALAAGDLAGAIAALDRAGWEAAWDTARLGAAAAVRDAVSARLEYAGRSARMPTRRLRQLALDEADLEAIGARLGAAAAPLFAAFDRLESAAAAGDAAAWLREVERTARRLDEAWRRLDAAAGAELLAWENEVAAVRAWRPPAWPFVVTCAVILGLGAAVGLMLGGYVDVPSPLRPAAEWVWGLQ